MKVVGATLATFCIYKSFSKKCSVALSEISIKKEKPESLSFIK